MSESLIQYGPKGNSEEIESILTHIFNANNEISSPDIKPTPLCIWMCRKFNYSSKKRRLDISLKK